MNWHINICIVIYSVFEFRKFSPSLHSSPRPWWPPSAPPSWPFFLQSPLPVGNVFLLPVCLRQSQKLPHDWSFGVRGAQVSWIKAFKKLLKKLHTGHLFEVEVRTSSRHFVNTLPFSIVKHIGGEKRITFSSLPVRSTSTWKYPF